MEENKKSTRHLFKGLQLPLEFMGIKGRYLAYTGLSIFSGIMSGFIVSNFNKLIGFLLVLVSLLLTYIVVMISQKRGLHSKKRLKGKFIVYKIFKE